MKQLFASARDYIDSLQGRERILFFAGSTAVALTLAFLLVIEPMLLYQQRLHDSVERQRELVSWMRGAAEVLGTQQGTSREAIPPGGLLAVVDGAAKRSQLGNSLQRLSQDGDNTVRILLEDAPFDSLLLWLDGLQQRFGISVDSADIERAAGDGLVNATLTLSGPDA
ncbi:MAG: type II secretion system protein M [Gammaproteobacteria bacterium]|nr:type II secretion system protein M [Gammaproteobacteria bacterium]